MLTTPLYNEKSLLTELAAGQEEAFTSLYNHYHSLVKAAIQRFVKSPDLAEDLSQEIFMKIWNHHTSMAEVDSFSAYLLTITRNHTLDFLRKAATINEGKAEIIRHARAARSNTTEDIVLNDYITELRKVYESLPAQTQEIFKMVKGEGKSYNEVAELLGISRNAVNKHVVRSNKAFKDAMENDLGISLSLLLFLFFRH